MCSSDLRSDAADAANAQSTARAKALAQCQSLTPVVGGGAGISVSLANAADGLPALYLDQTGPQSLTLTLKSGTAVSADTSSFVQVRFRPGTLDPTCNVALAVGSAWTLDARPDAGNPGGTVLSLTPHSGPGSNSAFTWTFSGLTPAAEIGRAHV